jgi:hypothetical protein
VSHYLKDGIFVPAPFFEAPLLALVPPGSAPPTPEIDIGLSGWLAILCAVAVLASATYVLPVSAARGLAYGATGLAHLAFSTSANYGPVEIYSVLSAAFVVTSCLQAGWKWGWAIVLAAGLVAPIDPALCLVLATSCKVLLDTDVLSEGADRGTSYGYWRRWSTAGTAVATAVYSSSLHTGSSGMPQATIRGFAYAAVAVLGVTAYRLPKVSNVPDRLRLSTRAWAVAVAVLCLGIARGALLPQALAAELVAHGFPAQVPGMVALISAIAEFTVLSMTSGCFGSGYSNQLAVGLMLGGVHLQVVCAVSASDWLLVLPISAVLAGVSSALVAQSIPSFAATCGSTLAQGALQSIELLGTAIAVIIWPQVSAWAGVTFAYQISADLLIVVGVILLLTGAPGIKWMESPLIAGVSPVTPPVSTVDSATSPERPRHGRAQTHQ